MRQDSEHSRDVRQKVECEALGYIDSVEGYGAQRPTVTSWRPSLRDSMLMDMIERGG